VSRQASSASFVPDSSFDSRDLHPTREHFAFILYILLLDLFMIKDTCNV